MNNVLILQGPMDAMIDDFCRMIWEKKIRTIVMVTKLKEEGQVYY